MIDDRIIFLLLFLAPVVSSIPIVLAYKSKEWTEKLPYLSVFGIFVSVLMSLYIFFVFPEHLPACRFSYSWIPDTGIDIVLITDYLSRYMGVITAVIAFFIAIYGLDYMKGDYRPSWYWFFFNLFTASMLLVVYSDNLFLLFVGWEGLGAASWGLIGHWFRDDDDIAYVGKAGRKVGPLELSWPPSFGGWRAISTIRFGDVPMFFAIAAIWVFAVDKAGESTLNISQIEWGALFATIGAAGTIILMLCFLTGLFTKSAQVPFSEWLMTAMTGPTTVSALLHSATMVAAGAFVFLKVTWYIQPWKPEMHEIPGLEIVFILVLFVGLISGLYGALAGSGMLERKVLLAASTMSSIGLMFAAGAASYWIGEPLLIEIAGEKISLALLVAFWYMAVHAFAKASLFLVSGHLIHATHSRFCCGGFEFAKRMKTPFIVTIIATTFLVGMPPLTAYWVKSGMDEVMEHLIHPLGFIPLILLILTSLIYSAIMARFLSLNFVRGEKPEHEHLEGGGLMKLGYTMMVSVLFILLYLIFTNAETKGFVDAGYASVSFAVGAGALIVYVIAVYVPRLKVFSRVPGTFFNDRMYLPFLNDYIVPKTGFFISRIVQNYGNRGIDGFFNTRVIPGLFGIISRGIRAIQTGYLKSYVKIVLGLVMVFLIIASLWGMGL